MQVTENRDGRQHLPVSTYQLSNQPAPSADFFHPATPWYRDSNNRRQKAEVTHFSNSLKNSDVACEPWASTIHGRPQGMVGLMTVY